MKFVIKLSVIILSVVILFLIKQFLFRINYDSVASFNNTDRDMSYLQKMSMTVSIEFSGAMTFSMMTLVLTTLHSMTLNKPFIIMIVL
jgi:hypothetical protein